MRTKFTCIKDKLFVQHRYPIIGLRQALRTVAYHCFMCRRYKANNIQPIKAPLKLKRYPDENHLFTFTNTGVVILDTKSLSHSTTFQQPSTRTIDDSMPLTYNKWTQSSTDDESPVKAVEEGVPTFTNETPEVE